MKRILWLAVLLALVIMALGVAGCEGITSPTPRAPTTSPVTGQNTGIWVTGRGEVTVTPDIAILEVGVEAEEATVSEAMDKASEAMGNIGKTLADRGIKGEDIQTRYFTIRQCTRWDDRTDEEIITGYRVTNKMTVKIRSYIVESTTLDYKASNIIDAVVRAGGNLIRIDDFSFSVEAPSVYYDEAREKATTDARNRAEKLAKQTGVKLGAPTYIAESASLPSPYESMAYGLSAVPAPAPVIIETPVSPGEVKVILTVQVAYSIR